MVLDESVEVIGKLNDDENVCAKKWMIIKRMSADSYKKKHKIAPGGVVVVKAEKNIL